MISLTAHTGLFRIFGYSIQTWGTVVALGIAIALLFLFKRAKQKKMLEQSQILVAYILVLGIICARIAYILVNPSEFSDFFQIFEIWKGGLISWGVFIGGFLGIIAFKIFNKIKSAELKKLLDLMAPYLILAVAIGRVGCFLRGCCFGIPTTLPWGLVYSGNDLLPSSYIGKPLHPTELYHSILDFIIFFILLKVNNKKDFLEKTKKQSKFEFFRKKGGTFLLFILLYSLERFFVDFLRFHPANEYIGAISITQLVFVFMIFISLFMLLRRKKAEKLKLSSMHIGKASGTTRADALRGKNKA